VATLGYQRIATEEAFSTPEILNRYRAMLRDGSYPDRAFQSLLGFYLTSNQPRVKAVFQKMADLGAVRLADMDASGIHRQVLSLAAPGVQVFDGDTAACLARESNDSLAEAIRRFPDRFAGMAAVAPQRPAEAAGELERGVRSLGLKGAIINSHTQGEFLDDSKFWPIFEAAEALDVPVYLHPTGPPDSMIGPFLERGLDGAIYGFAAETALHLLRIIVAGVFDRFPKLRIISGHLGEGLPYWLFRVDFMHARMVAGNRYETVKKLQRKPSDYVKDNMYVTSSGMAWEPPIRYAQSVLGLERVLYAMDYPWQFVPDEVIAMDQLAISDEEKRMFYQTNAEKVFQL
jgi:2,3-dihydroxybenzoate decarboxylase